MPSDTSGTAADTMAIYVRTSTTDQDGAAKLHALHRAAAARGWGSVLEYTDIGHSGAKASRPALDALKRAAKEGKVRQVMVFALDRLGRSLRVSLPRTRSPRHEAARGASRRPSQRGRGAEVEERGAS
ncbi:MAG: recombinase family protein [Myxococcales bacterium]